MNNRRVLLRKGYGHNNKKLYEAHDYLDLLVREVGVGLLKAHVVVHQLGVVLAAHRFRLFLEFIQSYLIFFTILI